MPRIFVERTPIATTETMNEEFKEWMQESKNTTKKPLSKKQTHTQKKPKGRCSICGEHQAKVFCIECKKQVCTECFFPLVGLCKKCIESDAGNKWKQRRPDWEKKLGIKWID